MEGRESGREDGRKEGRKEGRESEREGGRNYEEERYQSTEVLKNVHSKTRN